jgi:class 3 adenylate cyclase
VHSVDRGEDLVAPRRLAGGKARADQGVPLGVKFEGEEVDHAGDGFFVAFEDTNSALECAIEIQQTLAEHRSRHGFAPQVRIGVHASEATHTRQTYLGRGVHVAARIGAHAGAGEILVSRQSLAAAEAGFTVGDTQAVQLKGTARADRAYRRSLEVGVRASAAARFARPGDVSRIPATEATRAARCPQSRRGSDAEPEGGRTMLELAPMPP